ncbi:MAG: hypothetical protein FH758_00445 [Firmicutes bacterium]|nr:hypothetical protein [Bacillota bacterium]
MIKFLNKFRNKNLHHKDKYIPPRILEDEVKLQLEDVCIKLIRKLNIPIPHEVTIVIPRVEFRDREYENGELVKEKERIYNSITVVHAPRHPQENPPGFGGPEPPSISPGPQLNKNKTDD